MRRFLAITAFLLTVSAQAAGIDAVRKNYLDYYGAAGADRTAPRMAVALTALEDSARAYAAPGYLLANGSWTDIDYADVPDGGWSPYAHTQRLFVMAKAYRTPGQRLYNDPALRAAIEAGLAYVPKYYGVLTVPNGNWWFWTIGVPLDLGPTLVLMRGEIAQSVFDDCVSTLRFHIGSSPAARGLAGPTPVGENLMWSCYTHLALALARDDAAMLAAVRDSMSAVCLPTTGDGIQSDGSFHQHGAQLYTGAYGGAFATDAARYALLTRGTEFALPPAAMNALSDYLAGGVAWSLYGNYFDVSVIGREVARPTTSGYNGVAALVQASLADLPRGAEIRAAAAKMLESWQWTLSTELAALAVTAERSSWSPSWPSGHQHYFESDYSVHRRPGWMASVKMLSSRTKSGERTNGENLLGSRQSDGRFALSISGSEYFGNDAIPAMDWTRLPGTTVEQKADTASDVYGFGSRAFVGGASDGVNGVSAMDFVPVGGQLTAKKSWFFFDDTIVFLANGITSSSANRVETIIQQWPLSPSSTIVREGDWTFCDGAGYYVYPQSAALHVERITHTGTWAALGASTDTTPRGASFLTMWLDHGVAPAGAAAAYAVSMNPAARPPEILINDARVSAVRSGDKLGIVFWSAGSFNGYASSIPAIVYVSGNALTASDPANGSGSFTVTVPGGRTYTIQRSGGRSTTVSLTPQRRRTAAH